MIVTGGDHAGDGCIRALVASVCQPKILLDGAAGRSAPKKTGKLTLQMDEMWSFVGNKRCKQWIWLAMDTASRAIVGVYIGDRSRRSAQRLWQSLPSV